jgi:hypothetical protein
VVDGRYASCAGEARDALQQAVVGDCSRGSCCDDVGAERELRVDARLLVVGGDEDGEVDREGEQQSQDEQAAVDRRASSSRACQQESERRRCPAAGDPGARGGQ